MSSRFRSDDASEGYTRVDRVSGYRYLSTVNGLERPADSGVFFDPADTELGVYVALDLVSSDSVLFDLGSGGGGTCAAVNRHSACKTFGVDISPASVSSARSLYPDIAGSFGMFDYIQGSSAQLLSVCGMDSTPSRPIVTSNPAYVPLPRSVSSTRVSIDGGNDGLRSLPHIIRHATVLGADLGFTLGSYSAPLDAVSRIHQAGFTLECVTLTSLPVGDFTLQHYSRIAELERAGRAFLHRSAEISKSYLIVGLSCRRRAPSARTAELQLRDVAVLLPAACRAPTPELETVDDLTLRSALRVRVLVLPTKVDRHHW